MGCWVAPSVAAEYWRVSVEHVMDGIRAGTIPSKTEDGFLFVEAIPDTPALDSIRSGAPRRQTYVEILPEELAALVDDQGLSTDDDDDDDDDDERDIESSDFNDDEEGADVGSWRSRRQQAGTLRRAPAAR